MGKSGHFHEPRRHSLQAKGIKTGHIADSVHPLEFVGKPIPKEQKEELNAGQLFHKEIAESLGLDPEMMEMTEESGHWEIKAGDREYLMFDSEDDAEAFAKERVEEDLEENPDLFEPNWLQGHIDMERLKNALEDDVSEFQRNYYNDIESESDRNWQNRCVAELIQLGKLDEDDFMGEDGELKDITPELQDKINDAIDEAVDEYTDEQMDDPVGYLEELYSKDEAMKKAIELGGIDYDEASQDAIDTDGVAHFLASYDGNEIELPNGRVAYRTN